MGHLTPSQGRISFDGQDLATLPRHARAQMGIGYMPEDRGLVPELTVEENILVPVWVNKALKIDTRLALVYSVLPELREMKDRRALLLSGGQQKLVALARALAVGTRLLLLDEPFEGVAPARADRAERPEPRAQAGRRGIPDRAGRQPRTGHGAGGASTGLKATAAGGRCSPRSGAFDPSISPGNWG
jgi:ABC-type uncharacterized transport system YnjBCD ATPase subunit